MGSIKKPRKKYSPPSHPWQRLRIGEERPLTKEYGLQTKKEIWKARYILKTFKNSAKKLIASTTKQGGLENKQLIDRLKKYGMATDETKPAEILNLTLNDIMNRRLQTVVFRNNLARTIKQARQFIIHGHIFVDGRKITVPSYMVLKGEEDKVMFDTASSLASNTHPERATVEMKEEDVKRKAEAKKKKEEKKQGRLKNNTMRRRPRNEKRTTN